MLLDTEIFLVVAKNCLMSKKVEAFAPIVNCFATAMPSIVRFICADAEVGLAKIAFVTIPLVAAGKVKTSGNLPKVPCVKAAEAKVAVEVTNWNKVVLGTAVTTKIPSVPVVPELTETMSPIANPCAEEVVTVATLLFIALLDNAPPTVTPVLKIAEAFGVTEAELTFAFVFT